jgi:regulator of protease activity HflC (stomatin/prohibitin superfamily)
MLTFVTVIVIAIAIVLVTYALSMVDVFFTQVREGTWAAVMRGKTLDHMILAHRGYYLNDPRRDYYNPALPAWERIAGVSGAVYSSYPAGSPWRILERFGIYWMGLWPIKSRFRYIFEWTEQSIDDETGKPTPWHRDVVTDFAFSAIFTYWVRLEGAETEDNIPVDMDYWLSVEITNGQKALFDIENWLTRITADVNQATKMWVGISKFEELSREGGEADKSIFAKKVLALNQDLIADVYEAGQARGAKDILGVTIQGASLYSVSPSGERGKELAAALSARVEAERKAQARIAEAEGIKQSTIKIAEGDKEAIRMRYEEINRHPNGVAIRGLEAMEKASEKAGNHTIWAPNPFDRIADAIGKAADSLTKRSS